MKATDFPALLQAFFTDRLVRQRCASPHTIAGYRDSFRLLLRFAQSRLGKAPSTLALADLTVAFVSDFLDDLERRRKNSARTRNLRLAALHSFVQYVALQEPAHALLCQRLLALPPKRAVRRPIAFLTRAESVALVAAPPGATWLGRRDRALLLLAVQTGLRVSELRGLRCQDVVLGTGAHVHCHGKGRKERCTPLRPETATVLAAWLREGHGRPDEPLFPSLRGGPLSRDAIERLVAKYAAIAAQTCASLTRKRVSPHVLRHAAAMDLLHHGVDRTVIALWLGHESIETTQVYLHADMRLKEEALSRTLPLGVRPGRYRPDDTLLAFLESL